MWHAGRATRLARSLLLPVGRRGSSMEFDPFEQGLGAHARFLIARRGLDVDHDQRGAATDRVYLIKYRVHYTVVEAHRIDSLRKIKSLAGRCELSRWRHYLEVRERGPFVTQDIAH